MLSKVLPLRKIPKNRARTNFFECISRFHFSQSNKDLYQILGLQKTASSQEIKAAYYKLAKQYHPDVNKGTEERFKEINQAYEVLGDPDKKKKYDDNSRYGYDNDDNMYGSGRKSQYNQSYHYGYKPNEKQRSQYQDAYNQYYQEAHKSENYQRYQEFKSQKDYTDFRNKWYQEYEKAQEEYERRTQRDMDEAMEMAYANMKKRLMSFALFVFTFFLIFDILPGMLRPKRDFVIYDEKTGSLYMTDANTYNNWSQNAQDMHADPRFIKPDPRTQRVYFSFF